MHVAHVNCSYRPGLDSGAYLKSVPTLTQTCEALARVGCNVIVLQRFWHDEDKSINGVRYVFRKDASAHADARPWTVPVVLLYLAHALKTDVLHMNGLIFPGQVAMLRAAVGNRSRIFVQHHGELPSHGKLLPLQRLCLRFADGFIFNGSGNADVWHAAGIIRAGKPVFEAVEGSCDFAPMAQAEARRITGMVGTPAVLWVGRLHPRKDPLTAVDGFLLAAKTLPDAQLFMIYGDETLLPQVHDRLAHAGEPGQRVHPVGKVDHDTLPAWYSAADVFVTSSPAEGSNYALIESMSCGATPVCSDIPPHRFIAGDLAEYWPVGDSASCADALVRAFGRTSIERRSAIRQHFDTHLSWDSIARQLMWAYTQAVPR